MISHELKCIFIHIPRCGGTSVETWLDGNDWWETEPATKHLIASQARRAYAPWWNDYFKFSIVRDPYSRILSLLKFNDHFGMQRDTDGSIDFSGYEQLFGHDCVIEHDHRFAQREDILTEAHHPGCVYGNILDEALDFVGRFENLAADMAYVQRHLGFSTAFDTHVERSDTSHPALTEPDRAWIARTYAADFAAFGYATRDTPRSDPDRSRSKRFGLPPIS